MSFNLAPYFPLFIVGKRNISLQLWILFLYIISLFIDSLLGQILFNFSLSSIIAFTFAACSAFSFLKAHYKIQIAVPLVLSSILLFSLLLLELFIHHTSILNQYYRSYLLNIAFCFFLYNFLCKDFFLFKSSLKFIHSFSSILSILVCVGLFIDVSSTSRVTIFGLNENYFAFTLLFPVIITTLNFLTKSSNLLSSFCLSIPLIACLYLTGTRSSYAVFFLSFIFIFKRNFSNYFLRNRLFIYLVSVISACSLASLSIFPFLHSQSLPSRLFFTNTDHFSPHINERLVLTGPSSPLGLGGRLDLWKNTITLFRENHILGTGSNGFIQNGNFILPHNIFFEMLIVGGLFALVSMLIIFYYSLYPTFQALNPESYITYLSLLAPVLASLFFINIVYFKFFWLYLALFLSFRYHLKRGSYC